MTIRVEDWPIAGSFRISRGSKTTARVVVVELEADGLVGRGECVPYSRYGETVDGVCRALEDARAGIEQAAATPAQLALRCAPAAARNAVDCAAWDLLARQQGRPVWQLAGASEPQALVTAYTLSLDSAEAMAEAASANADRPLLKLKLGAPGDVARLAAVRQAVPGARLVVDANEGWTPQELPALLEAAAEFGVELVEQPLPVDQDDVLARLDHVVAICADESAHDRRGLGGLVGRYDAVNIKLDKTGGLTEALAMSREARALGLRIMVGCMVGTSLAMAPAMLVATDADWVDLDGPLLLARDREPGLVFHGSTVEPPDPDLWG
jgi:L-alanine-DL-glutamate epimerase-like enolase superfamily enzyme